jgi:hypothetical protein
MRRLAVEHYEWLATRAVTRFADLTGEQKDRFRKDLRAFSLRVRDEHLKDVVKILQGLPEASDQSSAGTLMANLNERFVLIAGEACHAFAPLMAGLSQEQITHIKGKLAERNEKYDPDRNGGLATYRAARKNDAKANGEEWFGPLNDSQVEMLDLLPPADSGARETWETDYLAYRDESQQAFLEILRMGRGQPGKLEQDCRAFVERQDHFLTPRSRRTRALQKDQRRKTGPAILAELEPPQRNHFRREIDRLIRDLNTWSAHLSNN